MRQVMQLMVVGGYTGSLVKLLNLSYKKVIQLYNYKADGYVMKTLPLLLVTCSGT